MTVIDKDKIEVGDTIAATWADKDGSCDISGLVYRDDKIGGRWVGPLSIDDDDLTVYRLDKARPDWLDARVIQHATEGLLVRTTSGRYLRLGGHGLGGIVAAMGYHADELVGDHVEVVAR